MANLDKGQSVEIKTTAKGATLTITTRTSTVQQFPELGIKGSGKFSPITLSTGADKKVTLMANTTYVLKADALAIDYTVA